jgi:two-component system NtrC family sensor kinase
MRRRPLRDEGAAAVTDPEVLLRAWRRERGGRLEAERRLNEKSRELFESYNDLEHALTDLKANQRILVQAEKMASLGVLAAGIAHEINNPVGYVLSNLSTLKSNLPTLVGALREMRALVERIDDGSPLAQARAEVLGRLEATDADYVLADTGDLIDETLSGLERVRAIVAGLRSFARTESDSLELTDVHGVIESALMLLHNQLKHACDIERAFGDVPRILANPGKLAQVLVNLLSNAVQAIEEKARGQGACGPVAAADGAGAWGRITVQTWRDDDWLCIAIQDTGCGIPAAARDRLFQPFFTTKPVGQGTGLGLAISWGIVQEHGGRIDVESEPGQGARFVIRLPCRID